MIPAYNEGENIVGVLRGIHSRVRARPLEVLVVHDFEADTTVPVVRRLQAEMPEVTLLHNQLGRGVLNALKAGLSAAGAAHVVVMMADASDDPAEVDRMLARALEGADLVAAARYMRGGRQVGGPLVKRLLSRGAGLSLHWLGGVATHDPTNNFKIYRRQFIDSVRIESSAGFELALELTVKATLAGRPVAELPTTWRDRTAGQSNFKLRAWLPHYLRWYGVAFRGRLRRMLPV